MDKQRLAEIMYELEQGKEELKKMGLSALLVVCEKGKMSIIGGANQVDLVATICHLIVTEAEMIGAKDVIAFMAMLTNLIIEGQEMGAFRTDLKE